MRWEVCTRRWVNVLLELPSLGYGLHGHDVEVEACVSGERRGLLVFDLEELKRILGEVLEPLSYRRLAKATGSRDASLEDLALHVCRALGERLQGRGVDVSRVRVTVPSGSIALECGG